MVERTIDDFIPKDGASLDVALQGISTPGEFVGQGVQGSVYRLREVYQGKDVAVKVLRYRAGMEDIAHVEREVQLLRGKDLPGVVRYHGYETEVVNGPFGTIDVLVKIYTDFVNGKSLENAGNLSALEIEKIYFSLLERTAALHAEGIVHRDLKPSNIMRTNDGEIVVIDLGIAKPLNQPTLTATKGAFVGSYNYTAPEIRDGKKHSPASDLYSLAPLILELARGTAYDKVVDREDLLLDLAAAKNISPAVRQGLEALLNTDPQERMKRFEMVIEDGKKLYRLKEVATVVAKKTVIEKDDFDRRLGFLQETAKYAALGIATYMVPVVGLPILAVSAIHDLTKSILTPGEMFAGKALGIICSVFSGLVIHSGIPTYDDTPTATDDPSIQTILDSTAESHLFPFILKGDHHLDGFQVEEKGSTCYFNVDGSSKNDVELRDPSLRPNIKKRFGVLVVGDPESIQMSREAKELLVSLDPLSIEAAARELSTTIGRSCQAKLQDYITRHPETVSHIIEEVGKK